MKRFLLGLALLALPWAVWADDVALYKVELIVFENLDPSAVNAELWPENPGTPPLDNAMDVATLTAAPPPSAIDITNTADTSAPQSADSKSIAVTPPSAVAPPAAAAPPPSPPPSQTWQWMDQSQLSLNKQVQRLNDSQHYKTILHVGWVQPLDSSDQGKAVHIYDGMEAAHADAVAQAQANVTPQTQTAPTASTDSTTAAPATSTTPAAMTSDAASPATTPTDQVPENSENAPSAAPHILDGTFTLRQGRFLHVDVDLGYTKTITADIPASETPAPEPTPTSAPAPDAEADAAAATPPSQTTKLYVRMTQSRRIHSGELHYLDHPLFGVLFEVTPYDNGGNDAPDSQNDQSQ